MRAKAVIPILAAALTAATMVYQARTVNPVLCETPPSRLPEIAGLDSRALERSEAEGRLPEDTQIDKRFYTAPNGHWYQVSMVISGRSKSSIHRPELCLPGQGFQMKDPHDIKVGGVSWRRVTLESRTSAPVAFAYTFYNQAGFRTSSHTRRILQDVWDRSVLGRIDRWVMITVVSSENDDRRLARFLSELNIF